MDNQYWDAAQQAAQRGMGGIAGMGLVENGWGGVANNALRSNGVQQFTGDVVQHGLRPSPVAGFREGINVAGRVGQGLAKRVLPGVVGTGLALHDYANTPHAQYEQRFGLGPSPYQPGTWQDASRYAGIRGLGFASDLGNALTGGIAGNFYRDQQQQPQQPQPQQSFPMQPTRVQGGM